MDCPERQGLQSSVKKLSEAMTLRTRPHDLSTLIDRDWCGAFPTARKVIRDEWGLRAAGLALGRLPKQGSRNAAQPRG